MPQSERNETKLVLISDVHKMVGQSDSRERQNLAASLSRCSSGNLPGQADCWQAIRSGVGSRLAGRYCTISQSQIKGKYLVKLVQTRDTDHLLREIRTAIGQDILDGFLP